jgi:hypothetical protein
MVRKEVNRVREPTYARHPFCSHLREQIEQNKKWRALHERTRIRSTYETALYSPWILHACTAGHPAIPLTADGSPIMAPV